MRVEALTSLQQTREAVDDPLVQGMLESLMTQLKRGVMMRDTPAGSVVLNQPESEGGAAAADLKSVRLEPGQVVIKGECLVDY